MSTIKANAILDASGGNTVTINSVTPTAYNTMGKNLIINGAMQVAQRGTSGFTAGNSYGLDRWKNWKSGSGAFTVEQSTDVPTTEPFQYSLKSTVTTTSTPSGNDYYGVAQYIEGNNAHSLGFGTSAAKTITLSFWVKSSITGTYSVAISNKDGATRTYAADYSISSANTWEKKALTISGDVTGTWNKDNTIGLRVWFALGMGSTYSTSTSNSWESSGGIQSPSAIDWISNSGATFYITGVQLEAGSVATEFERRPYGTELQLCQRYYEKSYSLDVVPGTATTNGFVYMSTGTSTAGDKATGAFFKVEKRATPTITYWDSAGNLNKVDSAGTNRVGAINFVNTVSTNIRQNAGGGYGSADLGYQFVASSEL